MYFLIVVLLIPLFAFGETLEGQVHSKEGDLLKLTNGRVVFLQDNEKLIEFKRDAWVSLEVSENNVLLTGRVLRKPQQKKSFKIETPYSYRPTLVTMKEAIEIFNRMRRDYQNESQCYNRAHIWSWEEYYYNKLNSMKLFLFFTNRYIRNVNYKWWFHVSPMVFSATKSMTVLDRRYARRPLSTSAWTGMFVKTGRKCPVVTKYSDYSQRQDLEDCYLLPTTMYFWQPRDAEEYERSGFQKTRYFRREVNWAYREAF